ncbi:unnamed protein product [Gadus morhua 'NCC']
MDYLCAAVVGTVGAGAAVFAAPFVLGAAGFTAAGITVGSMAAGMMSAAAVANGGAVAAGTTVAVLQSEWLVWGQGLLLQLLVEEQQLHWL